jgi:glycerophosphoryl diester phosphodiesterase
MIMTQILIAHRGNTNGPKHDKENTPDYIDNAILQGYDVEIDIWLIDNKIFLGHDNADTLIDLDFLIKRKNKLWCHAKNLDALMFLLENKLHTFSHDNDDYILTSNNIIWAFPGKKINENTICVMPERASYSHKELNSAKGICSDYIDYFKST